MDIQEGKNHSDGIIFKARDISFNVKNSILELSVVFGIDYLTDDQLSGPSRVEAYIRALQRSCRCVELDCWDGPEDAPVIYHGHTFTSKINLDAVLMAIKEYAFKASRYPVILSIENHCSLPQQKVMAHQFKTILGSILFTSTYIMNSDFFCFSAHNNGFFHFLLTI